MASIATLVALVLGTLLAFALGRYQFFGRESLSLLVILPIALPGIVTGIALNNVFTSFLGGLTIYTLIIGHATFCIVVVYNNSIARIRRMGGSVEEASADLGANGWRTFVFVTFPLMRSALIAGAILAFGLSFDEIIVTTFTAGPGRHDPAHLDLPEPVPPEPGADRQRGGRGPRARQHPADLHRAEVLQRRRARRRPDLAAAAGRSPQFRRAGSVRQFRPDPGPLLQS